MVLSNLKYARSVKQRGVPQNRPTCVSKHVLKIHSNNINSKVTLTFVLEEGHRLLLSAITDIPASGATGKS